MPQQKLQLATTQLQDLLALSTRSAPPLCKSLGQPVKSLIKSVSSGRTCRLDEPLPAAEIVQAKFVCHLACTHSTWQILLVCKHQDHSVSHLLLVKHLEELLSRILDAITVAAVYNEDRTICTLVVVPPELSDLILTTDVPDSEAQVLVLH